MAHLGTGLFLQSQTEMSRRTRQTKLSRNTRNAVEIFHRKERFLGRDQTQRVMSTYLTRGCRGGRVSERLAPQLRGQSLYSEHSVGGQRRHYDLQ